MGIFAGEEEDIIKGRLAVVCLINMPPKIRGFSCGL